MESSIFYNVCSMANLKNYPSLLPKCGAFDTAGVSTMHNASHIFSLLVQVIEHQTAVWEG